MIRGVVRSREARIKLSILGARRRIERIELLRADPRHPPLHFKRVGNLWSVRVGLHYRALAVEDGNEILWVWIGTHAEYDSLIQ